MNDKGRGPNDDGEAESINTNMSWHGRVASSRDCTALKTTKFREEEFILEP